MRGRDVEMGPWGDYEKSPAKSLNTEYVSPSILPFLLRRAYAELRSCFPCLSPSFPVLFIVSQSQALLRGPDLIQKLEQVC